MSPSGSSRVEVLIRVYGTYVVEEVAAEREVKATMASQLIKRQNE